MKSHNSFKRLCYRYSSAIELVGSSSAIALGVLLSLDKESGWFSDSTGFIMLLEFLGDYVIILYAIFLFLFFFGRCVKRWGDPWVWDKIQFILDQYQEKVFDTDDPKDHHRVTLFKCKRRCIFARHWSSRNWFLPWGDTPLISDYLIPVRRSGHISQKSSAVFHVPDDSDKAEGVAGRAWSSRKSVVLNDLPDINQKDPGVTVRRRYAENSNSNVEMVNCYIEAGRNMPRSIAAIPVEVYGKPWGVVVLDSRHERGVTDESVVNYSLTVALIGQLLERI